MHQCNHLLNKQPNLLVDYIISMIQGVYSVI